MYGRISPTHMSFFLLKQLTSPQRAKQSLDMMVSGVTKMSPFNDSCSNSRSDTEWIWLKKTKLFLTLNLSGALIHYWFVVGEITGSGPIILIMGLCSSLYYDWGEDITMVWEQSSFFCTSDFLTKLGYVHHRVPYIDAPNALRQCTAPKEKITMFCITVLQLLIDSRALRMAWLRQEKNLA